MHRFVLARGEEEPGRRRKRQLTGGPKPVSHCPPLSPLSPMSARRQKTAEIWREGGRRAKELGLCSGPPGSDPGESPKRGGGDGGESTRMTSPQDPLHPLPLHCKQRQESLPPFLVGYLHMSSDHIQRHCRWPQFPVTRTLFCAYMPSVD